jgi:methylmalonyl-CoA/ethylmalonyl-CoA epimerase
MRRLDHIGIAVHDLESALDAYTKGLGLSCVHRETVESEHVRTAFLPLGDTHLELLESLSPEGPVGRFLERRGEGIHHLCFEVEDVDAALARCRAHGMTALGEPRMGAQGKRVVFLHPRSANGVLIELSQTIRKEAT